jgi:UDP-glucose 4-epimerase
MSKLKCLVTGGAGFIGSHLVDELLANNYNVTVLDNLVNGSLTNLESALSNQNFTFIEGSILDQKICVEVMKTIDIVYHLACLGVRHSIHSPYENHQVNAEGSLNILEAARVCNVSKFFYISTSEVYGETVSFPIKETDLTAPLTVYGSSKLAGENYAHSYRSCYGLDTYVFRIFNNYGPRAHHEGDAGEIIPRSIVKILYGESPIIFGDGHITRDFFFVKDTAKVLTKMIDIKLTERTLNIGTGEEITMLKLVEKLIEGMPEYVSSIDFQEDRPADVPRLWVNNSLIKSMGLIDNLLSFEKGLLETIAYYKDLSRSSNLNSEIIEKNWEQ